MTDRPTIDTILVLDDGPADEVRAHLEALGMRIVPSDTPLDEVALVFVVSTEVKDMPVVVSGSSREELVKGLDRRLLAAISRQHEIDEKKKARRQSSDEESVL